MLIAVPAEICPPPVSHTAPLYWIRELYHLEAGLEPLIFSFFAVKRSCAIFGSVLVGMQLGWVPDRHAVELWKCPSQSEFSWIYFFPLRIRSDWYIPVQQIPSAWKYFCQRRKAPRSATYVIEIQPVTHNIGYLPALSDDWILKFGSNSKQGSTHYKWHTATGERGKGWMGSQAQASSVPLTSLPSDPDPLKPQRIQ